MLTLDQIVNVQIAKSSGGPGLPEDIPLKGVGLTAYTLTLAIGFTYKLFPVFNPQRPDNKKVYWYENSKGAIVTVGDDGTVTAVAAGTAIVSVVTADGSYRADCIVTVLNSYTPVTDIALDTYAITLTEGQSHQLLATITPADATNKTLNYTSDDSKVAAIYSNGLIVAVGAGTTTVSARADADNVVSQDCTVTVQPATHKVTGVEFDREKAFLELGATLQLSWAVKPVNASDNTVTFKSSDTNVATVSAAGIVTPVALGTANVTVTTTDGSYTDVLAIEVRNQSVIKVTGVSIKQGSVFTIAKTETFQLDAVVAPADATNPDYEWHSSNGVVATVDEYGLVTAHSEGTVEITVTTADGGFKAKATGTIVGVAVPVTGITVDNADAEATVGDTIKVTCTFAPTNATNKAFTLEASPAGNAVINVDEVTVTAVGAVTITATSTDGSFSDSFVLTVNPKIVKATSVSIDEGATLPITTGNSRTLNVTVEPSDASDKSVDWSVDHSDIVTVTSGGVVTGVKAGSAVVTVTTKDGSNLSDSITVHVTDPVIAVTGVSIQEGAAASVVKGETKQLTAVIAPTNASNKAVTWSSDTSTIATVSATGLVSAVANGMAIITVTTTDGAKVAHITITVVDSVVAVTDVTITEGDAGHVDTGATLQLHAVVGPASATDKTVDWSSAAVAVATVSATGLVTGIKAGTAVITCKSRSNNTVQDTITITVADPVVKVTTITVTPDSPALEIGETQQMAAAVLPANATNKDVTWASGTPAVATVSATGLVTALAQGTASITATAKDGSGIVGGVTVAVDYPDFPVMNLQSFQNRQPIVGVPYQATWTLDPTDAVITDITFVSDDETVLTVTDAGVITALKEGDAHVTMHAKSYGRDIPADSGNSNTSSVSPVEFDVGTATIDDTANGVSDTRKIKPNSTYDFMKDVNVTPAWVKTDPDTVFLFTISPDNNPAASINATTGLITTGPADTSTNFSFTATVTYKTATDHDNSSAYVEM